MAHTVEKKTIKTNCVDVEQINLELRLEQEKTEGWVKQTKIEDKPVKKRLLRLFKKAELNAKYFEQEIPIQRLTRQRIYKDYGFR